MNKIENPLVKLEHEVLDFWRQNKIFSRSLQQRTDAPEFVFYEGPPTANARPGLHHMISRVYKDVVCRFKTMRGYSVPRRAGWDTHGLPVEVQVEKALGLKNKKDIESLVPGDRLASIAEFNRQCQESVWRYTKDWKQFSERMGYWLDYENPYITCESGYIEQLWGLMKHSFERGWLEKSYKVVPYCPRCGTPLSSHEVAQEYQEVTDTSVYVTFPLKDEKDETAAEMLAWTTTPWTLPGNIALAVAVNLKYAFVRHDGRTLILAADLAKKVLPDGELLKTVQGSELVGRRYRPLFDIKELAQEEKAYSVIAAPFVTVDEGTGVVHTAAMYGIDDYEVAVKEGLPRRHTVNEEGRFFSFVPHFAGQTTEEATPKIVDYLNESGRLFLKKDIRHSYPFCWRCKSRLLYYAQESWFMKMSELKETLLAMNRSTNWIPSHLKNGRYGEWLRELRDWAFSRQRYWGTPLPVWTNKETGQHLVIGSLKELRERAVDKEAIGPDFDPHRPFVDRVVLRDEEGRDYHFDGSIVDVWFDSGAMPFASGEVAAGRYPADYISEAIDQTRGWFYTLAAVAALADQTESPYKTVISLGHVNDERGKKMSKSVGNIIDPSEAGERFGMDAIRFYLLAVNQPGQPKRFSERELLTAYRKTHLLLLNVAQFHRTYRPADWRPSPSFVSDNILDRWLISRLAALTRQLTAHLDAYQLTEAARALSDAVGDLSQWYLRRSRERKSEELWQTLGAALKLLTKLMAPLTPFLSESIWQDLKGDTDPLSVHLADWPSAAETGDVDEELLIDMAAVREAAEFGHGQRQVAGLKVRQPLSSLTVDSPRDLSPYAELLAAELNVQRIIFASVESSLAGGSVAVQLDTKLTPELKKAADRREISRALNAARRRLGLKQGESAAVAVRWPEVFAKAEQNELLAAVNLTSTPAPSDTGWQSVTLNDSQQFHFLLWKKES